MSLDDFPVSEAAGVFVGVAGFDWLAEGRASPLKALLCALAVACFIFLVRTWIDLRRKRQTDRQP